MAYRVVISYSTKDFQKVEQIRQALVLPDTECFVAEYSVTPGTPLALAIKTAIQNCDLFILLWSRNAANSEWVPQEIGIAHGCNKAILPVVLEGNLPIPGFIKELKYLSADRGFAEAVTWLRQRVQATAQKQSQINTFGMLAIGALVLWALANEG